MSLNGTYIPESKLRKIIGFKSFLSFLFFVLLGYIFFNQVYLYGKNVQYSDSNNTVKYHNFGYSVYNKNNELQEIYFYDSVKDKDFDLISYIKNNIILQNNDDLIVRILQKETTWMANYIKIFGAEKQEIINKEGYQIKGIFNENANNFIISYTHELANSTNYCFDINTLSMDDKKSKCVSKNKNEKNLPMSVMSYNEYYFVAINKQIYIINKKTHANVATINSDNPITGMSTNNAGDIKIKMTNSIKEMKGVLLEYALIKKMNGENVDLNNLSLSNL